MGRIEEVDKKFGSTITHGYTKLSLNATLLSRRDRRSRLRATNAAPITKQQYPAPPRRLQAIHQSRYAETLREGDGEPRFAARAVRRRDARRFPTPRRSRRSFHPRDEPGERASEFEATPASSRSEPVVSIRAEVLGRCAWRID